MIVRLTDGLGNQLFQYAAAQTLKVRTGACVAYLTDAFASRQARIDRPLLLPQVVACEEALLPTGSARAQTARLLHRSLRPAAGRVRHVPGLCHLSAVPGYHPSFDRISPTMLVSGFFQAHRCVADGLPTVAAAVAERFGPQVQAARAELRARFNGRRLVALHLRQGDYRQIGDGSEAIVPVPRIAAALTDLPVNAAVVAFSDTPEILNEVDVGRSLYRYHGANALADFAAMIACDDFVIANSTFSWWASTLGSSPNKCVWAPRDWLRPARAGSDPHNPIYSPSHRRY